MAFHTQLFNILDVVDVVVTPGASSKLMMSLVNDALKFQMAILQIHIIFVNKM